MPRRKPPEYILLPACIDKTKTGVRCRRNTRADRLASALSNWHWSGHDKAWLLSKFQLRKFLNGFNWNQDIDPETGDPISAREIKRRKIEW